MNIAFVPQIKDYERYKGWDSRVYKGGFHSDKPFWGRLKHEFSKRGDEFDFISNVNLVDVDMVIFEGLRNGMEWWDELHKQNVRPFKILVAREPPIYQIYHSYKHISKLKFYFDQIFTWNTDLVDKKSVFEYRWPYPINCVDIDDYWSRGWESRKQNIALVNSNTSRFWPINELYTTRKEIIRFYGENSENQMALLSLYGRGWQNTLDIKHGFWKDYSNLLYEGEVDHKLATIANHRFCFAIENMTGVNGYISEKIFDCFVSGTVPIYYGPPNVSKFIPNNCYINFRDFKSLSDLNDYVMNMSKNRYDSYTDAIHEYISDDMRKIFDQDIVAEKMVSSIYNRLSNSDEPLPVIVDEYIRNISYYYNKCSFQDNSPRQYFDYILQNLRYINARSSNKKFISILFVNALIKFLKTIK